MAPTATFDHQSGWGQGRLNARSAVNVLRGGDNVTESAKSRNTSPAEASIPGLTASLESILCTEELRRRPRRPPNYEKENRALVALASAMADSQPNILQTLAETILDVTQCDPSGLSLLTKHDGGKRFYWPAIAGIWKPHIGGRTPRDFGPGGDVLDRNYPFLCRRSSSFVSFVNSEPNRGHLWHEARSLIGDNSDAP